VTGSYAEGKQTSFSDIDFYILPKPEDEIDYEAKRVEDNYCRTLINIFESKGYSWDSCFISSFDVYETEIPLEFSAFYEIDEDNIFEIEILGVKMRASKSIYVE
jgi:predicted nucleotidyltransferase